MANREAIAAPKFFDYVVLEQCLAQFHNSEISVDEVDEIIGLFEGAIGQTVRISGAADCFVTPEGQLGQYPERYRMSHRSVVVQETFDDGVAVQTHPDWQGMPNHRPILLWETIDPFPDDADFV